MEAEIIIHKNATDSITIKAETDSFRYRTIMGENSLTLKFRWYDYLDIPVGSWVEYQAQIYTLESPQNFVKNHTENFEYTLTLEASQAKLKNYKLRNVIDNRLKFSYTAKPHEFIELIVANMNERDSGWAVGTELIQDVEHTVSFNHNTCLEALSAVAEEFNTEWEIKGKTIYLKKVEYNKDNPLPLSYGKGKGFLPGVGRTNYDSSKALTRLFVQGGERNINPTKYGNSELLLPKSASLVVDGKTYKTDENGLFLYLDGNPNTNVFEDSLDCTEFYPSRVGTVSQVVVVNASKNFYDIIDSSIPNNLNFEECLIEGETMTIVFQSGMLAGKEFDVKYHNSTKKFEIVPTEIDGMTMPGGNYVPQVGDKYAVFNCMLPDAYICDDATQTGASWDMFRKAVDYFRENEMPHFSFVGELDGIWSENDWVNIGGKIVLGGFILFSDNQFLKNGEKIRITGIKDYLNKPHSPQIELSNITSYSTVSSALREIGSNEVVAADETKKAIAFTKRSFQNARETMIMLQNALLNFDGSINPVTVNTMQLLVGDESLQFVFVKDRINYERITHGGVWEDEYKIFSSHGGILLHKTLGITDITGEHPDEDCEWWNIPDYRSAVLDDPDKKYYLYAKCSKADHTGEFILSEYAIKMEQVAGYYHFLVGVLGTENSGDRGYTDLYGFTEILPGRITADRVVSNDGKNFIDFVQNSFAIGNDNTFIDWNVVAQKLRIKNADLNIYNAANKQMISLNAADGSGFLAGGNFTWDKDGNIVAKDASLEDVEVRGTIRSPFALLKPVSLGAEDNSAWVKNDNLVLPTSGGLIPYTGSLQWDNLLNNGRIMRLVNYKWGSTIYNGLYEIDAPTGKYFYENGLLKEKIVISRELVDLLGYGDDNNFFGWIVLGRHDVGTAHKYGQCSKVMYQGRVIGQTSNGACQIKAKNYEKEWKESPGLTAERLNEGYYKVTMPTVDSVDNYEVMVTAIARTGFGSDLNKLIHAVISFKDVNAFVVALTVGTYEKRYTNFPSTYLDLMKDGDFVFQVISSADWF